MICPECRQNNLVDQNRAVDAFREEYAGRTADARIAVELGWEWVDNHGHQLLVPPDERRTWTAQWDSAGRPHWLPKFSTEPGAIKDEVARLVKAATARGREEAAMVWERSGYTAIAADTRKLLKNLDEARERQKGARG